jgi:hypothetical protein
MGTPTPEDKSRCYEIPIVFHDTAEFDVANELGYKNGVPTGEFSTSEFTHNLTEFDCSRQFEKNGE